jgi:hypothetical protein
MGYEAWRYKYSQILDLLWAAFMRETGTRMPYEAFCQQVYMETAWVEPVQDQGRAA